MLGVDQLGEQFSGMATRVEMVGMNGCLLFRSLLTAMAAENLFIVGEIVMLVFVEMAFGHLETGILST